MIKVFEKLNKKITNKDEFMNVLTELRENSKDYIVEPSKMAVLPADNGDLSIAFKDKEYIMNETAKKELALKLRIPYTYFQMLQMTGHETLLLKNINELLQSYNRTFMIRTTGDIGRAVLSNRFKRLDNLEVAEAVMKNMNINELKVKEYAITLDQMYIKFINPTIYDEIEPGDVVNAGFMISNSETGMLQLNIAGFYERLVCKNGMVFSDVTGNFKMKHLGKAIYVDTDNEHYKELPSTRINDYDFWKYNAAISQGLKNAVDNEKFLDAIRKMRNLKNVKIETTPTKAVNALGKMYNLAESEKELIKKHYIEDSVSNGLEAFGLMNAITRSAQDVTNYTRANKLEEIGGEMSENIKVYTSYLRAILEKEKAKENKNKKKEMTNLYTMMQTNIA